MQGADVLTAARSIRYTREFYQQIVDLVKLGRIPYCGHHVRSTHTFDDGTGASSGGCHHFYQRNSPRVRAAPGVKITRTDIRRVAVAIP
jgi:hypothetical protein